MNISGSGKNVQAWFAESCDEVGTYVVLARFVGSGKPARCRSVNHASGWLKWDDVVLCHRLYDEASIARVGHCVELYDDRATGTYSRLLLKQCRSGDYQVLVRRTGTARTSVCDNVSGALHILTYRTQRFVLCVGAYEP
jgi:hypothetical protein